MDKPDSQEHKKQEKENLKQGVTSKLELLNIYSYREYLKKYSKGIKKENEERIIGSLYIIFTLFTVSFFGIFAINPTLSTISNLKKQYQDSVDVERALSQKLDALKALDTQYFQIENALNAIYDAIPLSAQIAVLTRQLENLAARHNSSIAQLSFRTIELFPGKKVNAPIYSYSFSLELTGRDQDINKFVADLINFNRIVSIESVTTGISDKGASGASFIGRAYFYD